MLQLENVHLNYGHVHALRGVSMEVGQGRIVSLLGANGAGKSSTLKVLSGLLRPGHGVFDLEGESMLGKPCSQMVRRGVIHCPEGRRVFPEFTVEENLRIGAYQRRDGAQISRDMARVCDYFPRLRERMRQRADTLSGGEQQMLAIGRSLMGRPRLLLLDEPSLGIAPKLASEIFHILKAINDEGTTVLLVEQNAHMALAISDYAYILENGRVGLEGRPDDIRDNDRIRELYLGG